MGYALSGYANALLSELHADLVRMEGARILRPLALMITQIPTARPHTLTKSEQELDSGFVRYSLVAARFRPPNGNTILAAHSDPHLLTR